MVRCAGCRLRSNPTGRSQVRGSCRNLTNDFQEERTHEQVRHRRPRRRPNFALHSPGERCRERGLRGHSAGSVRGGHRHPRRLRHLLDGDGVVSSELVVVTAGTRSTGKRSGIDSQITVDASRSLLRSVIIGRGVGAWARYRRDSSLTLGHRCAKPKISGLLWVVAFRHDTGP